MPGEEVIFLPTHTVCIVEYPQVQFLARLLTCPLLLRQVRMVPDMQKTFGGAEDAVLLTYGGVRG